MKKILALMLVLALVAALAACTQVTRISVENPAKIMIEKEGGGVAVTLTDAKTVKRITDLVCQLWGDGVDEAVVFIKTDRIPTKVC